MIKKTNDDRLIYIGWKDDEEYYLSLKEDSMRGWSFMGLRPETEENLRLRARETEPEEILGLSRQEFENIQQYFDYDKFADDMEENWEQSHDIQAEREDGDTTYYLGFGSGTDIFRYFSENNITDFQTYTDHFEETGLEQKDFDFINNIIKNAPENSLKMTDEEKKAEKKLFVDYFLNE